MRENRPQKLRLSKDQQQKYEQLKSFSVSDYQRHFETGFRDLLLNPADREQLLSYVTESPLDARFWQALHIVEEQNPPRGISSDVKKLQDDFRRAFTKLYTESFPEGWVNLAAQVLFAVDELRRCGEFTLKEPNLLTPDRLAFMYEMNWEKYPATLQAIVQQLPSPMRRVLTQQKKRAFPAFDETLSALQTGDPEPFFTHLQ